MKRDLVDILVCPVCKGRVALAVEREERGEVISGTLSCASCGVAYRIVDGVPEMIPPGGCG